jgi:hypothetical protein
MGTSTLTMEEVRERIKRNFPAEAQSAAKRQKLLAWNRETVNTITSECGRYRISRMYVKDEDCEGYFLSTIATPTSASKHIAGPFLIPRDAREAAQMHADGIPIQADLA